MSDKAAFVSELWFVYSVTGETLDLSNSASRWQGMNLHISVGLWYK